MEYEKVNEEFRCHVCNLKNHKGIFRIWNENEPDACSVVICDCCNFLMEQSGCGGVAQFQGYEDETPRHL